MFLLQIVVMALMGFAEMDLSVSMVCRDQRSTSESPLICCDTAPSANCQETYELYLQSSQIELLKNVVEESRTGKFGYVQNCFRTALELTGVTPLSEALAMSPHNFEQSLAQEHREVFDGSMLPQDILVFDEQGEYRYWSEDGNRKKFEWRTSNTVLHAALYLGDGLVVQKENNVTSAVSLATLEKSHKFYADFAKSFIDKNFYVQKRTEVKVRVFRKVSNSH